MLDNMQERLLYAFEAHQRGELTEAERVYRELIAEEPDFVDANQLMGALLLQNQRPLEAIPFLARAVQVQPDSASFLGNLGIAYARSGQLELAVDAYQRSLRLAPHNGEVLKNLGTLFIKLKRYAEAEPLLQFALQFAPTSIELLTKLGLVHYNLGRNVEAVQYFDRVLEQVPDNLPALAGVGQILLKQTEPEPRAIEIWRRLTELDPENPSMHNNLATTLKNKGMYREAEDACQKALALMPDFFPALCNLGMVHAVEGRMEEAYQWLSKSLESAKNRSAREAADETARAAYSKIDEKSWKEFLCTANCQLASVTNILGNADEAHSAVDRALTLDPEHVDSHMVRGFLHLQCGEFAKGWPEYEWRKRGKQAPRAFPKPEWRGELAQNQTLLVHAEQGLGDSIQFCRYAKLVKQRVGRVIWLTHRPLVRLLQSCEGIDQLIPDGDPLPAFDLQVALMSLPGVFRTTLETVPNELPYLRAKPELIARWRDRLADIDGFRIGIAWQGNREFANDQYRRVPLTQFRRLAEIPGVRLISLQKGDGSEQLQDIDFEVHAFEDVDTAEGPFMDTAAIMQNVDLVISPCTATPHLAGALGVPIWLAKSFAAEWRWMSDDRQQNPWYPSMRMIRQPALGQWDAVFERMADEVRKLVPKGEKLGASC